MIRGMEAPSPPPPPLPTPDQAIAMLRAAIGQLEFARQTTLDLLAATPRDRWFEIPPGMPTNIAWQVGHLTVSQYGLLLFRIRGRSPADLELIPGKFRKRYGRGSTPSADTGSQPTADELYARLGQVDALARQAIAAVEPQVLLEPIDPPYAVYPVKLGGILFCPLHEQLHAGQIGLLRRALGCEPLR